MAKKKGKGKEKVVATKKQYLSRPDKVQQRINEGWTVVKNTNKRAQDMVLLEK